MADGIVLPSSQDPALGRREVHENNHWEYHPRLGGPIHAERHMRIICIGAGASGLLFAYKLQRSFSNFSFTIYEKNEDISGTWFENRYPG
jgi:hypothetical protein